MKNLLIIIAVIAVIALVFSIIALVVAYNYSNLAETNMSAKLVLDVVKMYLFA